MKLTVEVRFMQQLGWINWEANCTVSLTGESDKLQFYRNPINFLIIVYNDVTI